MNQYKINEIEQLINKYKIIVFMKGNKEKPLCGFSNTTIKILNSFNINYHTVNVLKDKEMIESIKSYSNWPTIPQVYINKEFIGGTDTMLQLYQNGQLFELLERSLNS